MTINYIIAAYFGDRRSMSPGFNEDRLWYLQQQIDSLIRFKNKLDQITIVISNSSLDSAYLPRLNDLIQKSNIKNIIVLHRPNYGFSYAAWDLVFKVYPDFDYYIVTEDDYVPVRDNFDDELIHLISSNEKCGYLCAYFSDHPAISVGICNGVAIRDILTKSLQLEYPSGPCSEWDTQARYHIPFNRTGWVVRDFRPQYSIDFKTVSGEIIVYGTSPNKIFKPI